MPTAKNPSGAGAKPQQTQQSAAGADSSSVPAPSSASGATAAARVAAAAAVASAAVASTQFVPKPKALTAVLELQESGNKSSKDRFINLFVLHCHSVDGKKLKDDIISNFSNIDALSAMTPDEMIKLYLTTELANIEELCEGYEEEGHEADIEKANDKWLNLAGRVQAARALQEYKNAMEISPANALEAAASSTSSFEAGYNASMGFMPTLSDKAFVGESFKQGFLSGKISKEKASSMDAAGAGSETGKGLSNGKARMRDNDDGAKTAAAPKKSKTEHTMALKVLQERLQGKPRVSRILSPYLQLILANRYFLDNVLPSLLDRGDFEDDDDLQEEIDFLRDKNAVATSSFATHFATNDSDNFNVPLAVAERFINSGLGDFSEGTLKSLGVTADQLKVVDAVIQENKKTKAPKKKEGDINLFCQKCGRTGHEATTCFAKTLAPGFNGGKQPRERDTSPSFRRRSRSPRSFFARDRHMRSPRR